VVDWSLVAQSWIAVGFIITLNLAKLTSKFNAPRLGAGIGCVCSASRESKSDWKFVIIDIIIAS
jgi:hypothetical protein